MTVKEQTTTAGKEPAGSSAGLARHGYRNEVNWEGGSSRHEDPPLGHHFHVKGRQPYGNQGAQETPGSAASDEFPAGNRAERSGQNLDQLERAKRRP